MLQRVRTVRFHRTGAPAMRLQRTGAPAVRLLSSRAPRMLSRTRHVPNLPTPQTLPSMAAPSQSKELLSQNAAKPAMCTMQLTPLAERRDDFEAWLQNGREALAEMLSKRRPPNSVPSSRLLLGSSIFDPASQPMHIGMQPSAATLHTVGSSVLQRCFQWIHVPSVDGEKPDLVVLIFTREADLAAWRTSPERVAWLQAGEAFARKDIARTAESSGDGERTMHGTDNASSGASIVKDAHAVALTRDDGSLGGWLPADQPASAAEAPPAWRVAATVLCAMYPMQELNRLLLMPTLDAASPDLWGAFSPSLQLFLACAFAAGGTTFVLLPQARHFTERVGFMGKRSHAAHALPRGGAAVLFAYAALLGVGTAASGFAERNWHVERLGKLTPARS